MSRFGFHPSLDILGGVQAPRLSCSTPTPQITPSDTLLILFLSSIHHFPIDSPPKNVYAQEGKAAERLEAAEVSQKSQQTQKQCNCNDKQEGHQKSQAAERQDASTGQTQWDGEGQDYDMEEVVQYSKERHDRETGKGGDREMSQGGDRGGKGGVGEEAGVQDVE